MLLRHIIATTQPEPDIAQVLAKEERYYLSHVRASTAKEWSAVAMSSAFTVQLAFAHTNISSKTNTLRAKVSPSSGAKVAVFAGAAEMIFCCLYGDVIARYQRNIILWLPIMARSSRAFRPVIYCQQPDIEISG